MPKNVEKRLITNQMVLKHILKVFNFLIIRETQKKTTLSQSWWHTPGTQSSEEYNKLEIS